MINPIDNGVILDWLMLYSLDSKIQVNRIYRKRMSSRQ